MKQRPNFPCMNQAMGSIDGDNVLDTLPSRAPFRPCEHRPTLSPVEKKVYTHPSINSLATYTSEAEFRAAMNR